MDGEANLPAIPASTALTKGSLTRPINPDPNLFRSFNTTTSSSSSSLSSSPPDFLRNVQAAFKRHRPLGVMQSNNIRPRRALVPQRETSKSSIMGPIADTGKTIDEVLNQRVQGSTTQTKNIMSVVAATQEDASITPPSISGTIRSGHEMSAKSYDVQSGKPNFNAGCKNSDPMASSIVESEFPMVDGLKKVQFAVGHNTRSQGVDDHMATGTDNLSTYMSSLALTEMEWDASNQLEASTVISQDGKNQTFQNLDYDISLRSDGGVSSLLAKRSTGAQDQLNRFGNFLQSDFSHHMTQSSVVGSSCATTTLVNLASMPMLSSTSYCTTHQNSKNRAGVDCDVNRQPLTQRDVDNSSLLLSQNTSRALHDQTDIAAQALSSAVGTHYQDKCNDHPEGLQSIEPKECDIPKDPPSLADKSTKGALFAGDVTDVQSQAPISKYQSSDVKSVSCKSEKPANSKAASAPRKKSYDPDLFFKVNGKLYQRLGKIGSGGSSEVHKVISQDCTIYALKKIKLKGRDYATAFGFCQEIEYLNKLRGKNHIIQLIDYEVTDKALIKEVLNGSMINKDGRVKDDGYIYMVLEYGEIDLAHMLSQKWKELDSSKSTIDENWLRFYWQQILLAVNTIHEERIVHSDLKPANFLLVRGSLKLIDFGIAKAIMSDTTNIQRDSQVGTLSYMSPEAFMCNETDANGNTIKCGRPSDIWSLGCILYQMVYGRTPFAEYKTFWAKFKVITDPNHEITFEPLSNIWLLDLMKKCLAWDRNERWRIPQLLQHPFLVPPIPTQLATPQDQSCKLLQLVAESCNDDPKALMLCSQLQQLLKDPIPNVPSEVPISREQRRKLMFEMSNLCLQLQEKL